jgi:hypothetical protein
MICCLGEFEDSAFRENMRNFIIVFVIAWSREQGAGSREQGD